MGVNPIKPRTGEGAFSKAWLNWLAVKQAYSDLADSVIYRPFTNRVLDFHPNTVNGSIFQNLRPDGNGNTSIKENALKRLSPGLKYIDVKADSGEVPKGAAGMLDQHDYGNPNRATIHINSGGLTPGREKMKHEVQHGIVDKMDYLYGNRHSDFYDRKAGTILPDQIDPADFKTRSQDEHIARSTEYGGLPVEAEKSVPPEERIVRVRPKFMQKGAQVYNEMKKAGVKLPVMVGAALGAFGLASNPTLAQAGETALNFTPANPIAEWANPRKLNALDEVSAIKNYKNSF